MNAQRLILLYAAFAAFSIVTNLGSQWLTIQIYKGPHYIILSVLIGTMVGLVTKYILDKRWIFRFRANNIKHELRTLALYTVMGGVTTLVFWGTEGLFQLAFGTEMMRFAGALLGLIAGYLVKYKLDSRLVFTNTLPSVTDTQAAVRGLH
jgi:putative flippase GtrA